MALDDLQKARLDKLNKIKSLGIDPYPAKASRDQTIAEAREMMDQTVTVAGRLRSVRPHGQIVFGDLEDSSGKIQLLLDKSELVSNLDLGDFLSVSGTVVKTQAGEITIKASDFQLLSKTLRPLPSAWYGLKDVEERYRRRYLDLLLNPEVREQFVIKSKFWQSIREFLLKEGFLEVETPVLEQIPGGADAQPFITHHNALDIDLYLRISLELPLKRLLVGGFEKVFEIGRIFRNEGIDDEHLQDYTQMEFYWAYADYHQLMDFIEKMYQAVIQKTLGSLQVNWQDQTIDWSGNWPRVEYFKLLSEHWGVDAEKLSIEELYQLAEKLQVKVEPNLGRGRLLDYIYKKTIRPKLIQPMFLINPPVEVEPLAKRKADQPELVERMQILALGTELGKGFSELNDPIDQRARFEEQMKLREAGDEEAQRLDTDFVEALEYGMPPAAGFGVSERLIAMLVEKPVREMVIFPPLKPANAIKSIVSKSVVKPQAGGSLTRDQALDLVKTMLKNPNLVKHCLAVESVMKGVCNYLRQKHPELPADEFDTEEWGIVGLLHDADYEATGQDLSQHTLVISDKIRELGGSERMINGIQGHYDKIKPNRENLLERAIYCVDELAGLITAVALVRPEKSLAAVTTDSVMKKMPQKSFAAGAIREQILACDEELGIPLRDFVEIALTSMQGVAKELGL